MIRNSKSDKFRITLTKEKSTRGIKEFYEQLLGRILNIVFKAKIGVFDSHLQ